jgi:uncharacterized protein (TIGR03066 family)
MRPLVSVTGCWILLLATADLLGVPVPPADQEPPKQADAEALIVGIWTPLGQKQMYPYIEFLKGGKFKVRRTEVMGTKDFDGKYRFLGSGFMEVEFTSGDEMERKKVKVRVTRDELETTTEGVVVEKFKRVK